MNINDIIQKIQLLEKQILSCKVKNSYLKSLIFKLNRKVELGSKTIKYLHYYFIKQPEKFNQDQTLSTLIGFLASLDYSYLYISPKEDIKRGFLNQVLNNSEDNIKRKFYFLLQDLDESIIEVQNILENALNISFYDFPDLEALLTLPHTTILPLSPASSLDESLNIDNSIPKTKSEPILASSSEIYSVLYEKDNQVTYKSESIQTQAHIQQIYAKSGETTKKSAQTKNQFIISEADTSDSDFTGSQAKEFVSAQKLKLENNAISSKIEVQNLNIENINESSAIQNPLSTFIVNDNDSSIITNQNNYNNEQPAPIITSESYILQNLDQNQSKDMNSNVTSYTSVVQQQDVYSSQIQISFKSNPVQVSYHGSPNHQLETCSQSQASSAEQPIYSEYHHRISLPTHPVYYLPLNQISSSTKKITENSPSHTQYDPSNSFNHNPAQTPPLPPRRAPVASQISTSTPSSLHCNSKKPPPLPQRRTPMSSPVQPIILSSLSHIPCISSSPLHSNSTQTPPLPPRRSNIPSSGRRYKPLPTPPLTH